MNILKRLLQYHIAVAVFLSPLLLLGWTSVYGFLFHLIGLGGGCFLSITLFSWGMGGYKSHEEKVEVDTGFRLGGEKLTRMKTRRYSTPYTRDASYGCIAALILIFIQLPLFWFLS